MALMNIEEYLVCFGSEDLKVSEIPKIELITIRKGEKFQLFLRKNKIIFPVRGCSVCVVNTNIEKRVNTGYMFFVPACHNLTLYTEENEAELMIFRIDTPIKFCGKHPIEMLYDKKKNIGIHNRKLDFSKNGLLRFKAPLFLQYIDGIIDFINTTNGCDYYFNLKIQEFFLVLQHYYTKKELSQFFSNILSPNTDFSEYVLANRNNFPTVVAFAKSMNMSPKKFTRQFIAIFQQTPYRWMKEGKKEKVYYDLTVICKSIKQAASDNGFNSIPQFTRFCKKEIGKTPNELKRFVCSVPAKYTN